MKKRYARIKYLNPLKRSISSVESLHEDDYSQSSSGVTVTERKAMTYAAIYRAVNIISFTVAKLPIAVFEKEGEDRSGNKKDTAHPAYKLLRRKASVDVTAFDFKVAMQASTLLHGNGYARIIRNGAADPEELIWINPTTVQIARENSKLLYRYYLDDKSEVAKEEDMLHIKGVSLDGITGISAIEYGANTFGNGLAMQRYGTSFFKNGAVPLVWLSTDGVLSDDAQKRLRDSWNRIHKGSGNAHRVGVGEQGLKPDVLSVNAKDSQLIESRAFSVKEIATWFGLPAHMLGDDTKTSHSSLEQENQSFLDNGIDPWLATWEAQCWDKLLTEKQKDGETHEIEFNRNALVKADIKSRFAAYAIAIPNGILSPNEVRAKENMNPREGGDEFLQPLNMTVSGEEPDDDLDANEEGESDDERNRKLLILCYKTRLEATQRIAKRFQKQIERAPDIKQKREQIKTESREYVRDALKPAQEIHQMAGESADFEETLWLSFDDSPDGEILREHIALTKAYLRVLEDQ